MWRKIIDRFRVAAWKAIVILLTGCVYFVYEDLLAISWLALFMALSFAGTALLAGPPYKDRTPPGKTKRLRFMSKDERRNKKGFITMPFLGLREYDEPARRFKVRRCLGLLLAVLQFSLAAALPIMAGYVTRELGGDIETAVAYRPTVSTRVFSADGEQICNLTLQDRVLVPLDRIPEHVRQAFIAAEDKNFYLHRGVDVSAIIRAAFANYESGRRKQGGSTLTQQVVKQVILKNNEKSYTRKFREVLLAVKLEKRLSKSRILEIYLNQIFLGHGTYGVQAAAQTYFGKDVSQLTLAEAAVLAGLPKAPSRDSPYWYFERAKERQLYVLERMHESGYISREEMEAAAQEEIAVILREDPLNRTAAPYFCEHVRKELKRLYGNEAIYERGLTVYTTLDMRMQRAAEAAVRAGLIDLERRLGFNGPEGRDAAWSGECATGEETPPDGTMEIGRVATPAGAIKICVRGSLFPLDPEDANRVGAWSWKTGQKLAAGDLLTVRLETRQVKAAKQTKTVRYAVLSRRTAGPGHPEALQAALIAIDPRTGQLKALVGGYDYGENQFNAATQARRQTGSSVKPYVYLSALMNGYTVDMVINDHPVCYPTASGTWCPTNYNNRFYGPVDLRTALALSLNSISVQLTAKVGVDEVIKTMRALGVVSPLERVMPISVGAAEMSLWEHTYAYASIAAMGKRMPRHPDTDIPGIFITRVVDEDDRVIYEAPAGSLDGQPQAVPADDAYAMVHLMKGVVESGTGRRVRELRRPAAGKTGTTNDFRDVWFLGFTPDLVAGVWVGRMTPQPIAKEATGGGVALPVWLAFMKAAHPNTVPRDFPVPADVVLMRDPGSGQLMPFQRGRVPKPLLPAKAPKFDAETPF